MNPMANFPVLLDSEKMTVYSIVPWRGFHKIEHYKKSGEWYVVHASGVMCRLNPETWEFQVTFGG